MLNIAQLEKIRKSDAFLFETLQQIVSAINALGQQLGTDPHGVFPAPPPIAQILVTAANGLANVQITDNSQAPGAAKPISYFVEAATDPAFVNVVHSEHLGPFRNKNIALGSQTLFFRAYSQLHGSPPSTPVVFGGNNPIAVTVGGSAAPVQQSYQGSGTSPISGSGYGRGGPRSSLGPVRVL